MSSCPPRSLAVAGKRNVWRSSSLSVLRRGMNLLIFPEGTRSRDGAMSEFKPTAGYLALQCGVDTLPLYIRGTHEALPPGQLVPRSAELEVVIGQPIPVEELRRRRLLDLPLDAAHAELVVGIDGDDREQHAD